MGVIRQTKWPSEGHDREAVLPNDKRYTLSYARGRCVLLPRLYDPCGTQFGFLLLLLCCRFCLSDGRHFVFWNLKCLKLFLDNATR